MSSKLILLSLTSGLLTFQLARSVLADKPARERVVEVTEAGPNDRPNEPNAGNQKNTKSDLAITQKIRRALVTQKGLSFRARNVAIITRDGAVTLRGSVASKSEKDTVEQKASAVAGADQVHSELKVPASQ